MRQHLKGGGGLKLPGGEGGERGGVDGWDVSVSEGGSIDPPRGGCPP